MRQKIIYTDSKTAMSWVENKRTSSNKVYALCQKAELYLKLLYDDISDIEIKYWNNRM